MENPPPNKLRAIVTGASSGIGKAIVLSFARAGIDVALVSRSLDKLEAVAELASAEGVTAKAYALDLARVDAVKEEIAAIAQDFGGVNILVNNAGMGYTNTLADTPLDLWQQVMDLNLNSVFQCVRGILPSMRQNQGGTIVNVASIAASNAFPEWGAYSVSKAGVVALTKTLALEERPHGIRAIVISPGSVNTPIWDTATVEADFDRSAMLSAETVAQCVLQAVLLPPEATIESLTVMPSGGAL